MPKVTWERTVMIGSALVALSGAVAWYSSTSHLVEFSYQPVMRPGGDCGATCEADNRQALALGKFGETPLPVCLGSVGVGNAMQMIGYNWDHACRVGKQGKDLSVEPENFVCVCWPTDWSQPRK